MSGIAGIIPAFNEESRISAVVEEVKLYVQKVIVVDDGSTDLTGEVASSAGAIVVRLNHNQGSIAAIKRGFHDANFSICVLIDADGEFYARDIPQLVRPILSSVADMVQGQRDTPVRYSEMILTRAAGLFGQEESLRRLAATHEHVSFHSIIDSFCTDGYCRIFFGGSVYLP